MNYHNKLVYYIKLNLLFKNLMNIDLLNKIKSLWGEAYYVGGCVRDYVMWLEPHDFDIATNVPMDLLEANFETYDIGKNKDFWVMIINYEGVSYDVAQFRADWVYSDGRHPEQVTFEEPDLWGITTAIAFLAKDDDSIARYFTNNFKLA